MRALTATIYGMARGSACHINGGGSREWTSFYWRWLQGVASILLEMALGSSRNYIVDGSGERPPFLGNCLKKRQRFYGILFQEAAPFYGSWLQERPPFSGSWLQGAAAILWELAPETGHYFMAVGWGSGRHCTWDFSRSSIHFIVDGSRELPPFHWKWLREGASHLLEMAPKRPPFYGSWLQGVAAILPDFFRDFRDFFRSSSSLRRFFARSSSQVACRLGT